MYLFLIFFLSYPPWCLSSAARAQAEISKIVSETRDVQREINAARDTMARAYALVEDILFRDAKKDELCKDAYRHLHAVHKGFADLGDKTTATGRARKVQRELEKRCEELAKNPTDIDRVSRDVAAVKTEISQLEAVLGGGGGHR